MKAGLQHIRQAPRDWDVLNLRWIDAEGDDFGHTSAAMAETGFRPCGQKWDRTSLVELPKSFPEYWQGREAKFRKNIARLEQRMAAQGKVKLIRCRAETNGDGDACRWDAYNACVTLAKRSWQGGRGDPTSLCHDVFRDFFRDAHAAATELGATDVNLLCFSGRPVAFAYNYCWKGAVYGLRKGFDPQFAQLRPGLVLQKLMLEDGHRRGDRLYDLGTGDQQAKAAWRTSVRTSYRFTYFPALALRTSCSGGTAGSAASFAASRTSLVRNWFEREDEPANWTVPLMQSGGHL